MPCLGLEVAVLNTPTKIPGVGYLIKALSFFLFNFKQNKISIGHCPLQKSVVL